MSEYQYFEFQALDTPLSRGQMDELRRISSRARISPSGFVNEYHWGDFKGNPDQWIEEYFDAFLHLANWGTRWLMFRLPVELTPEATMDYCVDGSIVWRNAGLVA